MMKGSTPTHRSAGSGTGRAHAALTPVLRAAAVGAVALLLAAACDRPVSAPVVAPPAAGGPAFDVGNNSAQVNQELAELRRVTAPFHDINTAKAAGWSDSLTDCMENPPDGGMGFHFANDAYIDGTAEVTRPQLLMYEPEKNGQMRLVGVEYIIPFSVVGPTDPAPQLFGHEFHQNVAFGIWGLHAWVWKHNPSGMFADWNPTVSCKYEVSVTP